MQFETKSRRTGAFVAKSTSVPSKSRVVPLKVQLPVTFSLSLKSATLAERAESFTDPEAPTVSVSETSLSAQGCAVFTQFAVSVSTSLSLVMFASKGSKAASAPAME